MAEQHLEAKIKDIRNTRKPLVVLLKGTFERLNGAIAQQHVQYMVSLSAGPGKDSSMMEMILRTSGLATLRDQATLFTMMAPAEVSELTAIVHAIGKAALPKIQIADLPVVMFYAYRLP